MSEYLRPSMRGKLTDRLVKKVFERMRISLDVQLSSGHAAPFR